MPAKATGEPTLALGAGTVTVELGSPPPPGTVVVVVLVVLLVLVVLVLLVLVVLLLVVVDPVGGTSGALRSGGMPPGGSDRSSQMGFENATIRLLASRTWTCTKQLVDVSTLRATVPAPSWDWVAVPTTTLRFVRSEPTQSTGPLDDLGPTTGGDHGHSDLHCTGAALLHRDRSHRDDIIDGDVE